MTATTPLDHVKQLLPGWSVWQERLTTGKHKGCVQVRLAHGLDRASDTYFEVTWVSMSAARALATAAYKVVELRPDLLTREQRRAIPDFLRAVLQQEALS